MRAVNTRVSSFEYGDFAAPLQVQTLSPPPSLQPATLTENRNRLFADYVARKGASDACAIWNNLKQDAKGAFLTLTHRLHGYQLLTCGGIGCNYPTIGSALDHVDALYSILGDGFSCGGAGNCIYGSMDGPLTSAMRFSNIGIISMVDANGVNGWERSKDIGGPHSPFNASDQTVYGHPRGQTHFFNGGSAPLCKADLNCLQDAASFEFDQDYDPEHDSSTECEYNKLLGRCEQCRPGPNRNGFDDGYGRMYFARQHPGASRLSEDVVHRRCDLRGGAYRWFPTRIPGKDVRRRSL